MDYLQLNFETENSVDKELLIALLTNVGFESFEEEANVLKAFIKKNEFNEPDLAEIVNIVPVNYQTTVIPAQNWNAQWESSFSPIVVNDFVAIRAAFHQPIKNSTHEIIITPKMSFGTGHHATTFMMIEQMEALDFTGKSVVDFGTGTAVLAILAEKMGAVNIDAIDYDEWSIENSTENIAANNCSNITLYKAERVSARNAYDIILANINLNVIQANLAEIAAAGKTGTKILLSGFLKADENIMIKDLAEKGIIHLNTVQKGDWICMLNEKT